MNNLLAQFINESEHLIDNDAWDDVYIIALQQFKFSNNDFKELVYIFKEAGIYTEENHKARVDSLFYIFKFHLKYSKRFPRMLSGIISFSMNNDLLGFSSNEAFDLIKNGFEEDIFPGFRLYKEGPSWLVDKV